MSGATPREGAKHPEAGAVPPRPALARPRVLRIITRLNVGGPATHVLIADRGLAGRGWETLLVYGSLDADETQISLDGFELPMRQVPSLVRSISPVSDVRASAALVGIIRAYRPHIIHTHLSKAGLLGRSSALFSSRAARIHTFHGTVFSGYFGAPKSGLIQRAERFLGSRSDRILALSERQRAELLAYRVAPEPCIRIVPLGLELARFGGIDRAAARKTLGIPSGSVAVVTVCRLVPVKRIDRMIRVAAMAMASTPALRLYVVGDGPERATLTRQAADLGIADRVVFAGWSAETPTWYAAADIVANSSDSEGTPLSLIEAAASSRASVATDVGGVADVVADGITGIVVAREDEVAFAAALARLAGDRELRDRLGSAAAGRSSRYSAERLVDDLDRLYHDVLAERERRG
jgi:glycosyltransferase involved in cell wall biosynthesis